jgi:hypothetical protein
MPAIKALKELQPDPFVIFYEGTQLGPSELSLRHRFLASHQHRFVQQIAPACFAEASPRFRDHFVETTMEVLLKQRRLNDFIVGGGGDARYVGLGHNNLNLDNTYFYLDKTVKVGLFDWNQFTYRNLGSSLLWGLFTAMPQLLPHEDTLLQHFVDSLHANGGPLLDLKTLKKHYELTIAFMLPYVLLYNYEESYDFAGVPWTELKGPRDPRVWEERHSRERFQWCLLQYVVSKFDAAEAAFCAWSETHGDDSPLDIRKAHEASFSEVIPEVTSEYETPSTCASEMSQHL